MLAQALFLIAVVAVMATSAIVGIAGAARANLVGAARAQLAPAASDALAQYAQGLATTIGNQVALATTDVTNPPTTVAALNGGTFATQQYTLTDGERGSATVTITPNVTVAAACTGTATQAADVERNAQCSSFVQESRLAVELVTQSGLTAADGTFVPLARARTVATLRLFAQAPYVAVAGVKDAADATEAHEGDVGGSQPALGSFASPPPGPGDTTIHVVYVCTPALGDCSTSQPRPQDRTLGIPWTNGNGSR